MSNSAARLFDRRTLLVRGGLVVGASSLAGAGAYAAAREVGQWNSTDGAGPGASTAGSGPRFLLDPAYVNLTTFLLASHPRTVREAIERHRRELDANAALYLRGSESALEDAARSAAAAYLGAEPDEVAFTDSTTMGLGLVYARLRLGPGEEVVTTEHDFYACRAQKF